MYVCTFFCLILRAAFTPYYPPEDYPSRGLITYIDSQRCFMGELG